MSKITYLQTSVFNKKDTELMRSELWWNVADKCYLLGETRFLLRFKSLAACKRFLKVYCYDKRICGLYTNIVKRSPWPTAKYCALNVEDIYSTEKDVNGGNGDSSDSVPNIDSSAGDTDRSIVIPSIVGLADIDEKLYQGLSDLYSHFGWSVTGDVFVPSAGMKHEMDICRRVNSLMTKPIASSGRLNLFEDDFCHSGMEEKNGDSGVNICPLLKGEWCLKVDGLKCDGTFYKLCSIFMCVEGYKEGRNATNGVDYVTYDGANSRDQHAS
jgi:hypothetical protein